MLDRINGLRKRLGTATDPEDGARGRRSAGQTSHAGKTYDRENQKPVLKCSICNGEQVAGFKDIRTGKFEEVMLIRDQRELDAFMKLYGIDEISKEY